MSTSPTLVEPRQVGLLVLDSDAPGASAVKQILDSEGWRVRVVPDTKMLLAELKTGEWSLVIANVALTGVDGPAFITLRELATVSPEEGGRIRALFLVPEASGGQYIVQLEAARLPYVIRPYHLHDFRSSPPGPPRIRRAAQEKETSGSLQFHVRLSRVLFL